jgi:hypothetical protein
MPSLIGCKIITLQGNICFCSSKEALSLGLTFGARKAKANRAAASLGQQAVLVHENLLPAKGSNHTIQWSS